MNTREVIKNLKLVGGSLALMTVAGIVFGVSKGLKYRKKYKRKFDPDRVEELEGHILEIVTENDQDDETQGASLILETESENIIPVHLGPEWYISHQQIRFKEGDKITVVGSRVDYQNSPVIIAAQIEHGNNKLILRDESGLPRWQSWVN